MAITTILKSITEDQTSFTIPKDYNLSKEQIKKIRTTLNYHPQIKSCTITNQTLQKGSISLLFPLIHVENLDLSNNQLSANDINTIATALLDSTQLKSLNLSNNTITLENCEILAQLFVKVSRQRTNLEKLVLRQTNLDRSSAIFLCSKLTNTSNLKRLDLGKNPNVPADRINKLMRQLQSAKPLERYELVLKFLREMNKSSSSSPIQIKSSITRIPRITPKATKVASQSHPRKKRKRCSSDNKASLKHPRNEM